MNPYDLHRIDMYGTWGIPSWGFISRLFDSGFAFAQYSSLSTGLLKLLATVLVTVVERTLLLSGAPTIWLMLYSHSVAYK
jgi:hypothetical protein